MAFNRFPAKGNAAGSEVWAMTMEPNEGFG